MSASTFQPWAVLPVKNIGNAKQRLAEVLPQSHRSALFAAMLRDVLSALRSAKLLAGTVMVTQDAQAQALAGEFGAEVALEPANDGHTAAVTRGGEYLLAHKRHAMLALPGDIPLLTGQEVDQLIESLRAAPALSIAPSADEFGSNGVLVAPPNLFAFAFGDDSFRPHLQRARAAGADAQILRMPGFALDVDQPEDLKRFASTESTTHAYQYLRDHELLGRLLN
jgi:2-phospho-L-lactate/phosphoenolpyruvate guanylyltransferase